VPEAPEFRYTAFISYRHLPNDRKSARWLQRQLEHFTLPSALQKTLKHSPRLGRFFRDESELPASSNLPAHITRALDESRFLIVVCSPATRESKWIAAEIEYFQILQRGAYILFVVIEGEPTSVIPEGASEPEDLDADHPFYGIPVWPLAGDLRKRLDASPRHVRREAILRLAAAIVGCGFDDLRQRDAEERYRRRIIQIGVASAIALLGIILTQSALTNAFTARQRLVEIAVEHGRQELLGGSARRALPWLLVAKANGERDLGVDFLINTALGRLVPSGLLQTAGNITRIERVDSDTVLVFRDNGGVESRQTPSLRLLGRINGPLDIAATSANGRFAVLRSAHQVLPVWDLAKGDFIGTIGPLEMAGRRIALGSSGDIAASRDAMGRVSVWDVRNRSKVAEFVPHGGPIERHYRSRRSYFEEPIALMDVLSNGDVLTSGVDGNLSAWSRRTGTLRRMTPALTSRTSTPEALRSETASWCVQSLDGSLLALGHQNGSVTVWRTDPESLIGTLKSAQGWIRPVAFAPDAPRLLVDRGSCSLQWWDYYKSQAIGDPMTAPGCNVALGSNGEVVAVGRDKVVVMDLMRGRLTVTYEVPASGVVVTRPSAEIITYSWSTLPMRWDVQRSSPVILRGHKDSVVAAAFDPQGRRVLTGSQDRTAKLWDLATGHLITSVGNHTYAAHLVAFAVGGKYALSLGDEGELQIADAGTGEIRRAIRLPETPIVSFAVVGPAEDVVAIAVAESYPKARVTVVELLSVATGRVVGRIPGETFSITRDRTVATSGDRVVTRGRDDQATMFELPSGRVVAELGGTAPNERSTFSADSRFFLSSAATTGARIWSARTGAMRVRLPGSCEEKCSFAVSPDERLIVTVFDDEPPRLWDFATGGELGTFEGEAGVATVDFALAGAVVVTAGRSGLKVWSTSPRVELLVSLMAYTGSARVLAVSPDAEFLFVGGDDGDGRVFHVSASVPDLATMEKYADCFVPWTVQKSTLVARPVDVHPCASLYQQF
jgi:WD40 repeat protein